MLNTDKFQFCQDAVQFGGLQITPSGVILSASMIQAILNFPVPWTITHIRSWFGLVNQVAWAYSLGPIMLPFQDLVKQNSKFTWNQNLEDAFKEGVATFDKDSNLPCSRLEQKKGWASYFCKRIANAILKKPCSAVPKVGT